MSKFDYALVSGFATFWSFFLAFATFEHYGWGIVLVACIPPVIAVSFAYADAWADDKLSGDRELHLED